MSMSRAGYRYPGLAVLGLCIGSWSAVAQITGDPELLRMVAVQNRANRESIMTWQGEAQIETQLAGSLQGITLDVTRNSVVQFAFDRATKRAIYVTTQTLERGTRNGKAVHDASSLTWGWIRTEDLDYQVLPYNSENPTGSQRPILMLEDPSRRRHIGGLGSDFDPFICFDVQGNNAFERLMGFHALAHKTTAGTRTVRRDGSRISLELRSDNARARYVFDLDQGANPVEVRVDGQATESSVREFQQVDGIWVPRSDTSIHQSPQQGMSTAATVNFTKHVLNKPLPADAFAPERLGIRKGDLVRDARTGVEYRFEGTPGLGLAGLLKTWKPLVVLGCLALALIVCLIGWRWRRRKLLEQKRVAVA